MRFAPAAKLLCHPEHLVAFKEGDLSHPPIGIELSPTNWCNAKCPWCFYSGMHTKEELDVSVARKLIEHLAAKGVKAITWTGGGDPSIYTGLSELSFLASELGLRQGIFTNGYVRLAHPEVFDWIRITVTEKYIISKNVSEYTKHTDVGVNFNLCSENESHLWGMALAAKNAGVRYFQVRPALAATWKEQKVVEKPVELRALETETFKVEFSDYKWDDYLKPHGYDRCFGFNLVPYVLHNGDVATCTYHVGKSDFILGNLYKEDFFTVWESRKTSVAVVDTCQHCCKLHEINKVLNFTPKNSCFP